MPKVSEVPEKLQPYIAHGVQLENRGKEWLGECPFCGRSDKFSVNAITGLYRCLICAEGTNRGGGNATVFIRSFWELAKQATPVQAYMELAEDRRLLDYNTLVTWGVVKSPTTGHWLVPGFGADGKLNQLYRRMRYENRMALLLTPTLGHQLHGVNLYSTKKKTVYLCEGPWDGMALWEILSKAKIADDGSIIETANPDTCMLHDANVLAAPGCNVFFPSWLPLFNGKDVVMLYDNDHPRAHPKTGLPIPPAGYAGQQRAISYIKEHANSVMEIKWGPEGFDLELPSGFDVRDLLTKE